MAATSLAEQLKRLAVPQSSIYQDDSRKASLLFDPKEAAHKDKETFYEIGFSGFSELVSLYEGFRVYEDSLFSLSSKDFERAVQSKEVNKNLDQTIEKFLLHLSPYLMLQSSHKALEWLVNRYHIHEYNQDAILGLILPYHETKIFARFIQIMDLKSSQWSWLEPIKKSGVSLAKPNLYNQCSSNPIMLKFIAKLTNKFVDLYGERASQLNTVFAFFCSTTIGTIDVSKRVTEALINALLPTITKALESPVQDFCSSGYIVLGFLATKAKLKESTVNELIGRLFSSDFELTYDVVLLINLIYKTQTHIHKVSEEIILNFSGKGMSDLCNHLKTLITQNICVENFVMKYLTGILSLVHDSEKFMMYSHLPEKLFDEVDLKTQHPESIICHFLDLYKSPTPPPSDDHESDIELIEEEEEISPVFTKWYSALLKSLETKYPTEFDKVILQKLDSKGSASETFRKQLTTLLSFKPAHSHQVGDISLFENLNHTNSVFRKDGVEYIVKNFTQLKIENEDFLKDSILSRFNDDDPEVVSNLLKIPIQCLNAILSEVDLANVFVTVVSRDLRNFKKWRPVIHAAIEIFCTSELLPVTQETILALFPHLFPFSEKTCSLTWSILKSAWAKKLGLSQCIKNLEKIPKENDKELSEAVFKTLFVERKIVFDKYLDVLRIDKTNIQNVNIYLLLKSCSFGDKTTTELNEYLSLLLESVENCEILPSSIDDAFHGDQISELINLSLQDKILFEFMEYIFLRLVQDAPTKEITKPWCNMCGSQDTIFVRRLYEIFLTGCHIQTYRVEYAKLLQALLNKFCRTPNEKIEFAANFACGHIVYAADPKDVIGPELQMRSLKLLQNWLNSTQNFQYISESKVLMLTMLFNLNNPLSFIRQLALENIEIIIHNAPNQNHVNVKFLTELYEYKNELIMSHEQIHQVLSSILLNTEVKKKQNRKNYLNMLMEILSSNIPAHILSEYLSILEQVNNTSLLTNVIITLKPLVKILKNTKDQVKFNVYESKLMRNVFGRIGANTATVFSNSEVWDIIEFFLKEYRDCVLDEDQTYTSPAQLILHRITEDTFKKVSEIKTADLVHVICCAGAFSNKPDISSLAAKVMRRIELRFIQVKLIFEKMLSVEDPGAKPNKKSTVSLLSHQLVETEEWKLGVAALEYVQNKKKMIVDNKFVSILFEILSRCLRFEEQSHVEYTKQLILSSLWYYCRKYVDDSDKEQVKNLKLVFDIELVVKCIRNTQNPQTHHHALILLSHAAHMLPEQVLDHTMVIFTFMGTSVLRHDDAYSFQIITKIIETLVPILVKLDKSIEHHSQRELQMLQDRVVPVLRIFADAVLHVPEHRRLPLYKKLLETVGANQFLWAFLSLLLETHIVHFYDNKDIPEKRNNRSLADQESPVNRTDFGQSILLEFPADVCLETFTKLIIYMKTLPFQKDEDAMSIGVKQSDIFSVEGHSPLQLRHYKYAIVTFISNCLASSRFIQHANQATDVEAMESNYKTMIVNILTFIQSISTIKDDKTAKYWRVMLHHSYDLLDHTNNLLSVNMFLSVIRGLLKHNLHTVRRKSMELLNSKIQFNPEFFIDCDQKLLFSLLPALLDIVKTIDTKSSSTDSLQDLELNQQTALLSLKLLARMLAAAHPEQFKPILETVTEFTCKQHLSGNVIASVVLCLAELCGNLKAHALASLSKYMPALLKILKKQRSAETPELILLSTITAVAKIVESLPLFLSPYLEKILLEYSILYSKWQTYDQDCPKVSAVVTKLANIKKKIAICIPPRVLIPVVSQAHQALLEKDDFDAIGPVMSVLADSFSNVTTADFKALQQDLTNFFLSALQLRSDADEKGVAIKDIDKAEDEIINALVALVLKLSEGSFRPFYFKLYDWAIRSNVDGYKDRAITFYRLSSAIAEKLKGLFVLFSGHFIKNAAELLDSCNTSKNEDLYFDSDEKCHSLVSSILKTLHIVFLYDSQNFVNKERFETLMQAIVDQLENGLGGVKGLKTRASDVLIPCIAQFAVAIADDSLWKLLNYQILLKTRHNDAEIRLTGLDCLVATATQLGSSWLPLLAESVPFLAELLEDGDPKIENATKEAIRKLEQILGEPLEKYF